MELDQIFKIWDRFERSSVDEMELDIGGIHLRLKESKSTIPTRNDTVSIIKEPLNQEIVTEEITSEEDMETLVKAPLVGNFYRASAPDAEPFTGIGQKVEKGKVIGIIEAMKLMNEIVAPVDGIVEDILAEDGSLVEYDQILMKIKQEK